MLFVSRVKLDKRCHTGKSIVWLCTADSMFSTLHLRTFYILDHDWLQTGCDVTKSCFQIHMLNWDFR